MSQTLDRFGIVGLGKMGAGMAKNALARKFGVAGLDTHPVPDDLKRDGLKPAAALKDFATLLKPPRFVILYVPAGPPVDAVLDELAGAFRRATSSPTAAIPIGRFDPPPCPPQAEGHSFHRRRHLGRAGRRAGRRLLHGRRRAGTGRRSSRSCASSRSRAATSSGGPGAGHFVKLVHNGIEFGMLQAIGEGIDLLAHYREPLAVADVLECWRHGSVMRSWLIELMEQTYRQQGGLVKVPPYVEDTGEVNWLVDDALHMEVPIPVITQSVMQLFASRDLTAMGARHRHDAPRLRRPSLRAGRRHRA